MSLKDMTLEEKQAMPPYEYGRCFMAELLERREEAFGRKIAVEFAAQFLKLKPANEQERGMDETASEYILKGVR